MKKISLVGEYKLYQDGSYICPATIPGSDFGNMINHGIIDNPLNTSSEKDFDDIVKPVYYADHTFEKTFSLDEEVLSSSHVDLVIDKVDTICKCFINGQLAFSSENSYLEICVDVKNLLRAGENIIRFDIASPVEFIESMQKKDSIPRNANGIDGAGHLRKPACHFGWDWGPCVPYKYIGDVTLECYESRIENISVKQNIKDSVAEISVTADNVSSMKLIAPEGEEILPENGKFIVENPKLWYSRDLLGNKNPDLYTLVLSNDEQTVEKKIGIRKIELNREKDEYGENFQFVLNGKRVFAKGANLIPFSAIPDFITKETVDYYLEMAVKYNFNMVRVWGGGEYANEYFLSRCDELGILVWQDFQFACLLYPLYNETFKKSVIDEAVQNVKRMTLHPSVALWCGNNEIEAMFSYLPKSMKIVSAYIKYHYEELPEIIAPITDIPYIPSSPLGKAPFSNNTADEVGDTHMWNVWHGLKPLDYYSTRYTRFLSEFGLESLPSMKAIKTFACPKDFDLVSDAFMSHQKCTGGNAKMMFYLKGRFDEPLFFEHLPYMTGIVQAECVQYATEHFRRNKGRCNGSIFWQYNDVWNCPSWAGVDYEGIPKVMMYKCKTFMAPVSVSYKDGKFFAYNDTMQDLDIDFVVNVNNNPQTITTHLPADSIVTLLERKLAKDEYAKVSWDNLEYDIDCIKKLEKANFTVVKSGNQLTIKADTYAKNVFIDCDEILEDNYFCLLPGEERTITFSKPVGDYKIICENNILTRKNTLKKKIDRFVYRLRPENIANYVYYEEN